MFATSYNFVDSVLSELFDNKCQINDHEIYLEIISKDFQQLVLQFLACEKPYLFDPYNKIKETYQINMHDFIVYLKDNYDYLMKIFINIIRTTNCISNINIFDIEMYIDEYINLLEKKSIS
jgi:hypothetical protein